jgi:hypothetical protein
MFSLLDKIKSENSDFCLLDYYKYQSSVTI